MVLYLTDEYQALLLGTLHLEVKGDITPHLTHDLGYGGAIGL